MEYLYFEENCGFLPEDNKRELYEYFKEKKINFDKCLSYNYLENLKYIDFIYRNTRNL